MKPDWMNYLEECARDRETFKTRHLIEIGNDRDTYALVNLNTKEVTIGGAPDFELVENGQVYTLENFETLVHRLDKLLEEIKKSVETTYVVVNE